MYFDILFFKFEVKHKELLLRAIKQLISAFMTPDNVFHKAFKNLILQIANV